MRLITWTKTFHICVLIVPLRHCSSSAAVGAPKIWGHTGREMSGSSTSGLRSITYPTKAPSRKCTTPKTTTSKGCTIHLYGRPKVAGASVSSAVVFADPPLLMLRW